MTDKYLDLLYQPHPVSKSHRQMSQANRAAQFAPFAALTGYDEAIKETSRWTDSQILLSEDQSSVINQNLLLLSQNPHLSAEFVYFTHDSKKPGGHYTTIQTKIKKIDEQFQRLIFIDNTIIPIQSIISIHIL